MKNQTYLKLLNGGLIDLRSPSES